MFAFFDVIISRFGLPELASDAITCFIVTTIISISVIIIGICVNKLEQWQLHMMSNTVGSKVASFICNRVTFPGTIIHELSHALFAILTGAKVLKIKCFEMFAHGRLGHVDFALRGGKIKKMIQLCLVSCAPVLTGIFLEYLFIKMIFTYELSLGIQIFLWYMVISVADHMSMSPADIKNYMRGLTIVFPMVMLIMLAIKYLLTVQ